MSVELLSAFSYLSGSMSASPLRKLLAQRVREFRFKAKLSQEELGFQAKLHRTYIGSIERAEQNVSVDNIYKLAKALKISPADLFK